MCRFLLSFTLISFATSQNVNNYSDKNCNLPYNFKHEIATYKGVVKQIIDYTVSGPFNGKAYDELAKFTDMFGYRPAGSFVLERAIDYMIGLSWRENVFDVTAEPENVPHWLRGLESVTMIQPRFKNISVLGLGYSVSTPPEGIIAEVVLVNSFNEFHALPDVKVRGKIVIWNAVYTSYLDTFKYRMDGASVAAQKGAVASLVRSITPFSINSPHTGMQGNSEKVTKIPAACITVEDAELIKRMLSRNEFVVLHVKLFSNLSYKVSRNTLIDVKGTTYPEKQVIVSGHIDSWDVGQGAMDDGGGMIISWAVPVILKRLNLKPKRTVRSVLWTSEELGLIGAAAYFKRHKDELRNINFIMESDEGTFKPYGLAVAGTHDARCIIAEVLKLFDSINATTLVEEDFPGTDIVLAINEGVPGASLLNRNEKYFYFHHTEADTMIVEDRKELDLCTAFWTALAYIIADMSPDIPRNN